MDTTAQKGIILVIFFLITMLAGSIPILLFSQCRGRISSRKGQAIISLLNCFAGGVFLGTSVLSLLVEGFEHYEEYKKVSGYDSEYPFFHLTIGVGFFVVVFVEKFAILVSKLSLRNITCEPDSEGARFEGTERKGEVVTKKRSNGNHHSGRMSGMNGHQFENPSYRSPQLDSVIAVTNSVPFATVTAIGCRQHQQQQRHQNNCSRSGDPQCDESGCQQHKNMERITGHSGVMVMTIFLALSFHTIFDGLAVGLQEKAMDIWTITIAINIHKTIVAVSLGLQLASELPGKVCRALLFLFVFALMAPLGIAIGMGVTSSHVDERAHLLASGVLQGVSTGSFLYVVFFEILREELGHHQSSVLKIIITLLGFAVMAAAKIWDAD